ncbi:MAG: hypothetical protein RID07_07530 [Lacipirellulaceae bacterium]
MNIVDSPELSAPRTAELCPPRQGRLQLQKTHQCLIFASSGERQRFLRASAEAQAWDAIICCDTGEFLRCVFRRRVPLIIIDVPEEDKVSQELRRAAQSAVRSQDSLLVFCGKASTSEDELWARSLGAWSFLPEATSQEGMEFVLQQAREALCRKEACADYSRSLHVSEEHAQTSS